jgi:predicted DNA-binding transcriptional regulator YafY
MSKFSNLLSMIILLKSKGKIKVRELSEKLEVDERMIRKYREDLEKAGVYIESVSGSNGGYTLKGYDHLLNLNLDKDELFTMQLAKEQLKKMEFIYYRGATRCNMKSIA